MRRGVAVWDSDAAMAFPEFEPNKRKVLFFCRGRGSGHAIPDIEITNELLRLRGDVEVRFVSYATGAKTLAEFGFPVIDLGLPELNSLLDVIVLATKITGWLQPDLVVAHEEFGALPAARVYDRPAILLTDWFVDADRITMGTLRFADQVLFIDYEGYFEEPPKQWERLLILAPSCGGSHTRWPTVRELDGNWNSLKGRSSSLCCRAATPPKRGRQSPTLCCALLIYWIAPRNA